MADGRRVQLNVALDCSDETIKGTVDDGTRPPVAFAGWLELMSLFDTVCAAARGTRPTTP